MNFVHSQFFDIMTLNEAQVAVDNWITTVGKGYFSELTNMAVLTEETGELARVISRTFGDQKRKPGEFEDPKAALSEELADILWVVICLANQTGVNLTEALKASFEKKSIRDKNRF